MHSVSASVLAVRGESVLRNQRCLNCFTHTHCTYTQRSYSAPQSGGVPADVKKPFHFPFQFASETSTKLCREYNNNAKPNACRLPIASSCWITRDWLILALPICSAPFRRSIRLKHLLKWFTRNTVEYTSRSYSIM